MRVQNRAWQQQIVGFGREQGAATRDCVGRTAAPVGSYRFWRGERGPRRCRMSRSNSATPCTQQPEHFVGDWLHGQEDFPRHPLLQSWL